MAISFAALLTSQRLERSVHPMLAANNGGTYYPFYVGCWLKPATVTVTGTVWAFGNSLSANNYFGLIISSSGNFGAIRNSAIASQTTNRAGAAVDKWFFSFISFISPVLVQSSILSFDGSLFGSTSGTVSVQPVGLDNLTISLRHSVTLSGGSWAGALAEFYYGLGTPIGSTTPTAQAIMQLAHRGPFAVPGMANTLLEYRTFRKGSRIFDPETDFRRGDNSELVAFAVNGQTMTPHVPLSPLYRRPNKARRVLGI
jgi:hypothetical protein